MRIIQLLLVEDEEAHCAEYREYVSVLEYPRDLYIANGEPKALELAQAFSIDVIILDLELHYGDGDGILFLKKLRHLALEKAPYIIVITHNPSPETRMYARRNGADYIFWKAKPDYSPKLVVDFAFAYFLNMQSLKTSTDKQPMVPSIENEILSRIERIGITSGMTGKGYLVDAIALVAMSCKPEIKLNKDVYHPIAKKYKKSVWSIEKAIAGAINKAWCITDQDTLAENYTSVVGHSNGNPTNREFIFYYADKVKRAYKA